jgi:isoleucyl-tRNA synthetase
MADTKEILTKTETALREEKLVQYWKENHIFEKSVEKTAPKGDFVFYDGPPFATGLPHMGHLLASSYKDAIGRYKTMQGYRVPRRWGWDCHGLPVESLVEKKLGLKTKKDIEVLGVEKFNAEARASVTQFVTDWEWYVDRIGRWVDFKNSYKTMDNSYMESVWWALKRMHEKKLLYEGNRVLMYCTHCETPLAKAEIQMDNTYKQKSDLAVTARFMLKTSEQTKKIGLPENTYILAWTTTPWTLPGNVGLAVGPDIDYVLLNIDYSTGLYLKGIPSRDSEDTMVKAVKRDKSGYYEYIVKKGNYIVAKDIFWKNRNQLPYSNFHPLGQSADYERDIDLESGLSFEAYAEKYKVKVIKGSEIVGIKYEPLYTVASVEAHMGKKHEVLAADFVTTTDGTGVVHTAVMYGEDDYNLGKKEGLPMVQLLTQNGHYNEKAPELVRDMFYEKGATYILNDLESREDIFKLEKYDHSYPHCYRCGTALIYNAVASWFLGINSIPEGGTKTIKERMLEENKEIGWVPGHLRDGRFNNILEGAPDWTISRNRFWATPLPIWKCTACPEKSVIGSVEELRARAQQPVPEGQDLHRPYIDAFTLKCEMCNGEMKRTPEVVDCWVESGSMPFAELGYPRENKDMFEKRFPGDFITEYIAQTRTWFYYTHAMGVMVFDTKAFKNVTSTGTILAADGEKMSKSKGNYTDPKINLDLYGADALRFYLMGSPVMQAEDTNFRDDDLKEMHSRIINMLWNSYTFYDLYAKDVTSGIDVTKSPNVLDRWILSRLSQLIIEVTTSLDGYETTPACRSIRNFVEDYSTWYLRRSRERIKEEGEDKQFALATMRTTMLALAKVIAPLMPFIAESIYQGLHGDGESVHLAEWPQPLTKVNESLHADMDAARTITSAALEARSAAKIKVRQPLALLTVSSEHALAKSFDKGSLLEIVASEVNVKSVQTGNTGQNAVILDTVVTPELQAEGYLRDLVRAIQDLRKQKGLNPSDTPTLTVGASGEAKTFIEAHSDAIKKATHLGGLTVGALGAEKISVGGMEFSLSL